MSIRLSKGGRLLGIMAGLGGAAMIGSAGRSWAKAVFVSSDYLRYDIRELNGADGLAMLVLGLFVISGAACFIALGSRRMWMTTGAHARMTPRTTRLWASRGRRWQPDPPDP
jgi:hypothetical protein